MTKETLDLFRTYLKSREASFLMGPVKIVAKAHIPEARLTTFNVPEMKEGSSVEVPRWVAETLEENGLASREEESVETELNRALQREKLQGPTQLSQVKGDLYLRLKRYLVMLRKRGKEDQHYQKVFASANSLMTLRLGKMVALVGLTSQPEPHSLLSPEELTLFREIKDIVLLWRSMTLGGE
ncbi:MAG: hypothetical protein JRN39_02855 [Nitrososphaerota archaeon]|nr:hypothetical protein [Nitrososphaerota archaeon]